jgi:hypothetical protein
MPTNNFSSMIGNHGTYVLRDESYNAHHGGGSHCLQGASSDFLLVERNGLVRKFRLGHWMLFIKARCYSQMFGLPWIRGMQKTSIRLRMPLLRRLFMPSATPCSPSIPIWSYLSSHLSEWTSLSLSLLCLIFLRLVSVSFRFRPNGGFWTGFRPKAFDCSAPSLIFIFLFSSLFLFCVRFLYLRLFPLSSFSRSLSLSLLHAHLSFSCSYARSFSS